MKKVWLLLGVILLAACGGGENEKPSATNTNLPLQVETVQGVTSSPTIAPTLTHPAATTVSNTLEVSKPTTAVPPPIIQIFNTTLTSVDALRLQNGTQEVNVSWQIDNRPKDSNLVFEQLLPDGTARNIELPRDVLMIPNTGNGVVKPILPVGSPENIQIQLRLVNLTTNATLVSANLRLPVQNYAALTVTPIPEVKVIKWEASPLNAKTGDPVTLTWEIQGVDSVGIFWAHSAMRFGWTPLNPEGLPSSGSQVITAPEYVRSMSFILTDPPNLAENIFVTIDCLNNWFVNPRNWEMCPYEAVKTLTAAYQPFERGFMIWAEGTIWAFVNGGTGFNRQDTWTGEAITFGLTPPTNLFLPQRGFGKIWSEDQAIRDALGWATAPESNFQMQYQATVPGPGTYAGVNIVITQPDSTALAFDTGLGTINWR